MFKVDLHTHSILSHDGGLNESDYVALLNNGVLDYVAITDHNEIEFALKLREKLGDNIIVGEEIMTGEGEVTGLYLHERIPPALSIESTIKHILNQKGLAYIPHPFRKFGRSISRTGTEKILSLTDQVIIETFNARTTFFSGTKPHPRFPDKREVAQAASSDAHCRWGVGTAYTLVSGRPDCKNLVKLISEGDVFAGRAPLHSLFCPKINKFRKLVSGQTR